MQKLLKTIPTIIGGILMFASGIAPNDKDNNKKFSTPNDADLPQVLVPHVKLGFRHFLFLNSGTPLAREDGNSRNCVPERIVFHAPFFN